MALYFDDLEVGQTFESAGRTITNHDVMTFAGLSGDNNELHTNDEYAKNSPFGQRIAHGLLVVAITTGLTQRLGLFEVSALALLDLQWQFKGPVYINDTIRIRLTIDALKATSKGDRGIVTRRYDVLNQRDEIVQVGNLVVMMKMRPKDEEAA
ncbi:MAG: MaoC/PaaZ C-terminal domain-containing protein [Alphaproteobacteria bacterium]|jgi:acyl dehydratase|nr:MaoC/PaaZ C-terminal domain-containing protein [Alphaproteobacteria bacterium]MDP6830019.1 MaoC/PaaZ C-terminal domain-containing protein [Alphaproteobacteria bacterium]MDP6873978.1 MaoC/PaaZ C-terminal domain-containing protein [Alphaproteobacteria bacterium]